MDIVFKQANGTNFRVGRTSKISYIVIHYTANNGDTAKSNVDYFAISANLNASAHYFVDERPTVYQSVKDSDTAWHCGGGRQGTSGGTFFNICTNNNAIGIEMCSRKDAKGQYYIMAETVQNALALSKKLMSQYGIESVNVIRHFDVTGKVCPEPFVRDAAQWNTFKQNLNQSNGGELTMTQYEELKKAVDPIIIKYGYVDENMPEWARPTIDKLVKKGYIKGNEQGNLQLNDTLLRMLVINDRAGLYD